jgi:hypothetical protein
MDSSGVRKQRSPFNRRLELHAFLADLAQLAQTKHLETAGISENRPIPAHEAVQAPRLLNEVVSEGVPTGGLDGIMPVHIEDPRTPVGRQRLRPGSHGLGAPLRIQLAVDIVDVFLDCSYCQAQFLGNILVGATSRHQPRRIRRQRLRPETGRAAATEGSS